MNKQRNLLVNFVIMITITACGNISGIETAKPQPSQTQAPPSMEEPSEQAAILPTETAQPTEQPTEQPDPYSQIQTILRSNPPCGGSMEVRKDAILTLDEYLKNDASRWDPGIIALYENMLGFVESEINEPVLSGVRIWSMYNHGFIVKTPTTVFAFDLVHGYPSWKYRIPDAILEQIQVLFVSHKHDDHYDRSLIHSILDFGGKVVAPLETKLIGDDMIYVSPGDELNVAGLHVKVYDGLHGDIPSRIFEVITPEGLKIMHTGDNQTSETLPDGVKVDILLLNAWVNESGSAPAITGVRNSINKLAPGLTILGHFQELSHAYDPSSVTSRLSYGSILAAGDVPLPGQVSVQIWGERCDFPTK
jgi:hypothetical protein